MLLQTTFIDGVVLLSIWGTELTESILVNRFGKDALRAPERILKSLQTLPLYQLAVVADPVTDNEQIGAIALVFDNPAAAKSAAGVIPARMPYTMLAARRQLKDILPDRPIATVHTQVIEDTDARIPCRCLSLRRRKQRQTKFMHGPISRIKTDLR